MKSISGAATTNRLVLCRSGESAQPTPGPAGFTGLIVFVLPLRRRLAPSFSPPPLLFIVFEIARPLRIEELYVELSRFNLPVIPFWGPTEELRNIVFSATSKRADLDLDLVERDFLAGKSLNDGQLCFCSCRLVKNCLGGSYGY